MKLRLAAALVIALSTTAHAGDGDALLGDARVALDDIDFEGARGLIDRAISAGDLDAATLAQAYRLAGEVAAALDDAAAAQDAFARWILLDPEAALAGDESPKIAEPFAAAQASVARSGPLTIDITAQRRPAKVRIAVAVHDPLGMIAGFRVRLPDGAVIEQRGLDVELPADDDTAVAVEVLVIDTHGNTLAEREVSSEPEAPVTAIGLRTERDRFPAPLRWPTWTGLTIVSGAIAGYFVVLLGNDRDDLAAINADPGAHTFDEVTAVEDRGDRHALYANLAAGVAVAAAITTVLTYVLEPGPVEIAPAPGGAAASVRF